MTTEATLTIIEEAHRSTPKPNRHTQKQTQKQGYKHKKQIHQRPCSKNGN